MHHKFNCYNCRSTYAIDKFMHTQMRTHLTKTIGRFTFPLCLDTTISTVAFNRLEYLIHKDMSQ